MVRPNGERSIVKVWVGVPVISPVFGSIDKLAGRAGEISKVPPGTIMYGAKVPMSVLFNATKVGGGVLPFGDESGPAIQTGGTAFGTLKSSILTTPMIWLNLSFLKNL